jgi:hypothetical protein
MNAKGVNQSSGNTRVLVSLLEEMMESLNHSKVHWAVNALVGDQEQSTLCADCVEESLWQSEKFQF